MKQFGGATLFLDRNDINTDEIIPAKYLTENSKLALKPFMLEDLRLPGFDPASQETRAARVIVTRQNFGCGSSREHAVWVFEVNDINVVIGQSFARIFRQNMFNCGMLAIELAAADLEALFAARPAEIGIDLEHGQVVVKGESEQRFPFVVNPFDRDLVLAGGWLAYADRKY